MKIKMKESRFGRNGALLEAGKVYDLDGPTAKKFIANNWAEEVVAEEKESELKKKDRREKE